MEEVALIGWLRFGFVDGMESESLLLSPFATAWMDLESIMLSGKGQRKRKTV